MVEVSNEDFAATPILFNDKLTCIIGGKSTGKSLLLHNMALAIDPAQVKEKATVTGNGSKEIKDVNLDVDMELAYQYFSKAAMLGVPNAYYKCGDMFFYGKYVAIDPFTAYRLYSQCYEMVRFDQPMDCYPDVCRRLGTCYHKGIGTEKDLKKAEEFLAEARRLFQRRADDGDRFTANVLQQATKEWLEVTRELES